MDNIISANTLFHFTPTSKTLISILKNGLNVRYSLEIFDSILEKDVTEISIPMACFCDIPLSQIKNHTTAYGSYAIGLSKNWGITNKVSPVHYVYPNSTTAEILQILSNDLLTFFDIYEEEEHKIQNNEKISKKSNSSNKLSLWDDINKGQEIQKVSNTAENIKPANKLSIWDDLQKSKVKLDINELSEDIKDFIAEELTSKDLQSMQKVNELQDQLAHFVRYLKPYEGKIYRNDRYSDEIQNFYNEREWRFVPDREILKKVHVKDSYSAEFFKNPVKRRYINIKLASHVKLNFMPSDVRFIIVGNDREIPHVMDEIHNIYKDRVTYDELRLLSTRLISLDQIIENI